MAATYSLDVFHSVGFYLLKVLIAKIYVFLGEDVAAAIVVSVASELIGEIFRIRQYSRTIKKLVQLI